MISIFNGTERRLGANATQAVYAKLDVTFRDHICEFTKGGHADLGVFIAISLHADENGRAHPSIHTLERETGYERATISRALARLSTLRINGQRVLLRYQRTAVNGTFSSNQYIILPSPGEVQEFEIEPDTNQPCSGQPHTVGTDTVPTRDGSTDTQTRNSVFNQNHFSNKNHNKPIVGGGEREARKKNDAKPPPVDKPVDNPDGGYFGKYLDAMKYFGVREPKRGMVAQKLADYTLNSGRPFADVLRGVWRVYRQAEGLEASGRVKNGIGFAISQWEKAGDEILATDAEAFAQLGMFETDVTQMLAAWNKERGERETGKSSTSAAQRKGGPQRKPQVHYTEAQREAARAEAARHQGKPVPAWRDRK